jgi:hypothetical protein
VQRSHDRVGQQLGPVGGQPERDAMPAARITKVPHLLPGELDSPVG